MGYLTSLSMNVEWFIGPMLFESSLFQESSQEWFHIEAYLDLFEIADHNDRKYTSRYCNYQNGKLLTKKSKKKNVVSISNVKGSINQ